MFKKKTLVASLVALFSAMPPLQVHAQAIQSRLSYVPESEISHAIGVYITKHGQDKIFNNIDKILENNGLSVNEAYFHHQHFDMEEQSLENMLPAEGAIREAALEIKRSLQRFLMGLEFNDHKFSFDLHEIDLKIDWQDIHVEIDPVAKLAGKVKLKLVLEARGINVDIAKFRAQDLNNDILGVVGLDDASLFLSRDSVPLRFEVPVSLINSRVTGPKVEIGAISSNIEDVILDGEFRGDVYLPEIEIRINGRVVSANYDELEGMLKDNNERIVEAVKTSLNSWVTNDGAAYLNGVIEEQNREGLFKEVNVMSPAGAPEGEAVTPFEWGIKFKEYDLIGETIHLTLDGYLKDKVKGAVAADQSLMASRPPLGHRISTNSDFVLSVNEGFINRIVQLSYNRGYFNEFDTADGETYKIAEIPKFKIKNSGDGVPPRLEVELEYTVTGVGAALVNNPIRINFDLKLDFPVEDGQIKIIATDIDMDSVKVDKKYIRRFLGMMSWSGVVMPQVRKRFKDAAKDIRGLVLADEFPLPASMGGIPLFVRKTEIEPSGHLLIDIDTELGN